MAQHFSWIKENASAGEALPRAAPLHTLTQGPRRLPPCATIAPHVISTVAAKGEEKGERRPTVNCYGLEIAHFLPLHHLWLDWLPDLHLRVSEAGRAVTQGWTVGA